MNKYKFVKWVFSLWQSTDSKVKIPPLSLSNFLTNASLSVSFVGIGVQKIIGNEAEIPFWLNSNFAFTPQQEWFLTPSFCVRFKHSLTSLTSTSWKSWQVPSILSFASGHLNSNFASESFQLFFQFLKITLFLLGC